MPSPALNLILRQKRHFSPRQIPGLEAWLSARSLNLANNAPVETWPDLSGNGINPAQATGTKRPIYLTAGINGQPALYFDAIDDVMFSSEVPLLAGTSGATVFVVYQSASNPTTAAGGIALVQTNTSLRLGLNIRSGSGVYDEIVARRLDNDSAQITADNPGYRSSPKLIRIVIDYQNARLEKWSDGGLASTINPFQTPGLSDTTNVTLRIGHPTSAVNAKFAEIVIYRRVLSRMEMFQVERHLSTLYRIPLP